MTKNMSEAAWSSKYEPGVSCPKCADELTEERRERLRERHRQVILAAKRNSSHIGKKPEHKPKPKEPRVNND